MKRRVQAVLLVLCLVIGRGLHAQSNSDPALSLQGFTGILNTPNGHVQREGTVDVLYSNQDESIRDRGTPSWEDSYLLSVGMFNFAEVGGRLTNTGLFPDKNSNSSTSFGIRDLSVNGKLSTDPLTARFRFSPALAIGLQDPGHSGGGAHNFETTYVVGSVDPLSWVQLSAGYGHGPDRMKGAFGGAEFRAHEWVTLLADYDTSKTDVGVRITTSELPHIPVRLTATFSSPVQDGSKLVISAGLTIPLGFKKTTSHGGASSSGLSGEKTLWGAIKARKGQPLSPPPSSQSDTAKPVPVEGAKDSTAKVGPVASASVSSSRSNDLPPGTLEALRERLIKDGFVNVRVGQQEKTLVVEYENIRYNHSELDAIGVVSGIASQAAGSGADQLRLVVKRQGLSILQIETQLLPLRDWLNGQTLNAPAFSVTQKVTSEHGIGFVVGDNNPRRLKPSLMIYPSLATYVGTEYGLFDYQLSVRPELQVPLWTGAVAAVRADLPVAWTPNLYQGHIYAGDRTPARLDRAMFFQALPLAPGLVANLGAGKILTTTNGVLNELSWTLGGGMNRFKAIQAWGRDGSSTRNVLLGSYRFFLARHDLAFEATAGRFYGQDTGTTVSMQRFFGDESVSLYFKDSVTPGDNKRWLQAGMEFDLPLTRRRDMKARPIQIRGTSDWSYAQETGIASSSTQTYNYIQPGLATVPETSQALALSIYDRERLNANYILSHRERIKDAWQLFRAGL